MGKLIFFALIATAVYFFFFKKKEVSEKKETQNELIMCDKCKTFYPKNEIKQINGKNICKDCYANS